ncbi:MAG: SusC/RagA family TonB-linked outer membrane protein [Mangrovibacterium sp.]
MLKNSKNYAKKIAVAACIFFFVGSSHVSLASSTGNFAKTQQEKGSISISGKVVDEKGQPIPGTTVVLKGTMIGTVADADGNFNLEEVSPNATLQFSFVGMKTQEVNVAGQKTWRITLQTDSHDLEEVVAVGYGTMKKSDVTGAVAQVKADDLRAVAAANPIEALQGRSSGVAIMNGDASPGAEPSIRIRGSGSITAGNSPLIVVDGFPLVNSNLNDINSEDIASMEVLKDASSAAIYGSRGANGVILITTKKGQEGSSNIEITSSVGIQTPARVPDLLDRDDLIAFVNEAYTYSSGIPVYSDANPAPNYNTNWQDEIIKNSSMLQNHNISFTGGNAKTKYMLSANIYNQDGLVEAAGYNRLNVRSNLSHDFKKWLTVGTNMQVGRSEKETRITPTQNVFRYGWSTTPVKKENGDWYYASEDPSISSYFEGAWNPVSEASEVTNTTTTDRVLGDIYAQFKPVKNVTFKTNFGADIANAKNYEYQTSKSIAGINTGGKGVGGQGSVRETSWLTENVLSYSSTFNDLHRLSVTGVYSWQKYVYEDLNVSGSGFEMDEIGAHDISLADPSSMEYTSDKFSNTLISWTARAVYTYNDKYTIVGTARYDGSSRFGANNKWGFFPSLGFSWRVDQESFMQNVRGISALKFRASYGVTGNQEIGNYKSLSQLTSVYYITDDKPILGFEETIGNPDLKWERNTQYNVGFDISLFHAVDFNFDYYSRRTTDLLYNVPIPTTSGYNSMLDNIGEVKNYGWEFNASSRIFERSFKWDVSANLSFNKNEIVELYGHVDEINVGSSSTGLATYLKVGEPVNSVWARESAGIIRTQEQLDSYRQIRSTAQFGEEMYVDKDNSKSISTSDYINIGSTMPDLYYGFTSTFEFKGFTLDILAQGSSGVASAVTNGYLLYGENQILNSNYIPTKYAYDRMWSESNPNGEFPRAGAKEVYLSDRTNGNWKYFAIKNIKLAYNFKEMLKGKAWISDLSVYANMQNYVTWSNQRGYNPESGDTSFPFAKAVLFGVRAKF